MHLVEPLVTGIRGAESGSVDFYRRGTSTRVTYYTSFEGDGATTPDRSVSLDTNGGGVFYVNELTTVVVKDSGGTEVRRFVAGAAASGVEVISPSFTGVDYSTGASGASKPLALSTALDSLYTSFGARDFNVVIAGSSTTVQSAFSGLATLYFNVKSTAYGATGDGVTNDVTAIQAAIDAAEAAGGGIVFFPRGTYKINSTLNVKSTVSLLGVGPAGSAITSAAADLLTMAASSTYVTSIEGLRLVTTNLRPIDVTAGRLLRITNCHIDCSASSSIAIYANTAAGVAYVSNCRFSLATSGTCLSSGATGSFIFHVYGCKFIAPAAPNNAVISAYGATVVACEFVLSAMSSGTLTLFTLNAGASGMVASAAVIGCSCGNPAGGTATVLTATAGRFNEGVLTIGNVWGSSVVHVSSITDATEATYFGQQDFDRDRARQYWGVDDTAAITLDPGKYATIEVLRTTTGIQTVTLGHAGSVNRDFTLVYYNNHAAGGGTITMAGPVKGLTTFTVNANCISYYFFKSQHLGTAEYWVLVGSAVNIAE